MPWTKKLVKWGFTTHQHEEVAEEEEEGKRDKGRRRRRREDEEKEDEEVLPRKMVCFSNDPIRGAASTASTSRRRCHHHRHQNRVGGQQDRAGISVSSRLYPSASTAGCSALRPTRRPPTKLQVASSPTSPVLFPSPLTRPYTSPAPPPSQMYVDEPVYTISPPPYSCISVRIAQ